MPLMLSCEERMELPDVIEVADVVGWGHGVGGELGG